MAVANLNYQLYAKKIDGQFSVPNGYIAVMPSFSADEFFVEGNGELIVL